METDEKRSPGKEGTGGETRDWNTDLQNAGRQQEATQKAEYIRDKGVRQPRSPLNPNS